MRELTATEVSRNFSAVLDSAERGETIVVTRGGEPVATIVPTPRANGGAVRGLFARWAERADATADAEADADFADRMQRVREQARGDLDSDPWQA